MPISRRCSPALRPSPTAAISFCRWRAARRATKSRGHCATVSTWCAAWKRRTSRSPEAPYENPDGRSGRHRPAPLAQPARPAGRARRDPGLARPAALSRGDPHPPIRPQPRCRAGLWYSRLRQSGCRARRAAARRLHLQPVQSSRRARPRLCARRLRSVSGEACLAQSGRRRRAFARRSRRRRVVMVGYQLRFHPCFLALQRAVRERSLGDLLAVRSHVGEYLPGWQPYEDYRQMYASRADLGGGVLVTQIHEFDYLYALFGVPRRLFALGGHWSHLEIDVEDAASTLMEFQLGGRPLPVHLQQDYIQRPPSRGCEIVGDRGKILMDLPSLSVTRYDQEGKVAETARWENFDRNQLFLDELRHFLDCVETRRKPVADLRDGIWGLRMALAAR